MLKKIFLGLVVIIFMSFQNLKAQSFGEFPPFTDWYENPLGFSPLELHTGNALYLAVLASTACLIFTSKDTSITNKFSFYDEMGMSFGYNPPYTNVYQNNIGILYNVRSWMSLGAELTAYHFKDSFNDTWGIGVRPFVRWYPVNNEKFRLYFESGAGILFTSDNFPKPTTGYGFLSDSRTGTKINGTPKYGIGAEYNFNKKLSGMLSVKHIHLSNGNSSGAERNPGHDSNGLFLGIKYTP